MQKPVIVIGAGAAGIIASWNAAKNGAKVILLEKTDRIGTKILISGGGKCNITHAGTIEEVIKPFRQNERNFIRPSCYSFPNDQIIEMLTSRGLEVYTRDDGRIFPVHQTAKDVVNILKSYLLDKKVEIKLNEPVLEVKSENGKIQGVQTESGFIESNHVILCSGGSSYPKTGTTGDGFTFAQNLGHKIVKIRAALAPIIIKNHPLKELTGVAFRDCILKATQNGKEFVRWRNDCLITHKGISGPTTLGISREVSEHLEQDSVHLEADLMPDLSYEELQANLLQEKQKHPQRHVSNSLPDSIPQRIIPWLLNFAEINKEQINQQLSKKEINRLIQNIKSFSLGDVQEVWLDKGEVVAGGVSLDEVDPQSMRSSKCQGLYLCGEVLDIAGPVGGYNLQSAFATGFVAGESASMDWMAENRSGE